MNMNERDWLEKYSSFEDRSSLFSTSEYGLCVKTHFKSQEITTYRTFLDMQ
jgi:hypothetical protein